MKDIFLKTETEDVALAANDFVIGVSDLQNQQLFLKTDKGEWKENPKVGVGLFGFLNNENPNALFREIREALTSDGMTVRALKVLPGNKIGIDAEY